MNLLHRFPLLMLPDRALYPHPIAFKDVPIVGPAPHPQVLNCVSTPMRKRMDMINLNSACFATLVTIGPNERASSLISHKYSIPQLDRNMSTTITSGSIHGGGGSPHLSTFLPLGR